MQLVDNRRHHVQYFGFTSVRHVVLVVDQNSLQQLGDNVVVDHLQVISLLNICVDELENLLLDRTETTDFGHLGCDVACACQY
jgi:hypothetical protein